MNINKNNCTKKAITGCIIVTIIHCCTVAAQNVSMNNVVNHKRKPAYQKENILGYNILKALKENNSNAWISLYPSNEEYKSILQLLLAAKNDGITHRKIKEMMAQRKQEAAMVYDAEFKACLQQAASFGICWKEVVLEKFDFETVYPKKLTFKYLNGDIWFKCKQHHFVAEGIEAVEIKTGYRLQAVKGIRQVDDGE